MADFAAFKRKAETYLRILEERQAKYGGDAFAPISLINQINDYRYAIAVTDRAIKGEISESDWKDELDPLILEIDPVKEVLQASLEEYFQEPITRLNDDTRQMWQKTIRYAQYGFLARIWMSVIIFLVGLVILAISSWRIIFGDLSSEQLFGTSLTFVGGLGAMFAVIYSGPLKEIRKSVNDLGIASAAFIAYVHRILEISHTFTFYYLKEKMSFEEMVKSNKLIDEAMSSTINTFRHEEPSLRRKASNTSANTSSGTANP
jgi:hypothetical protein